MMEERWAARLPMGMFSMNVNTGEIRTIHKANDWLNHLLFSPTDPSLLMFYHEGPWHKVDRNWTIRTDGTELTKIHRRTMAMEIFGHEFWSADGKTIWYDLQTPRGEDFWLAAYNVDSGKRTWYHLQRDEWSIHFNVSRDGKLFWRRSGTSCPRPRRAVDLPLPASADREPRAERHEFCSTGRSTRRAAREHVEAWYRLEPNVSFTPDQKWVVFRSNMFGRTYVFAVEVDKPATNQTQ